MSPKHPRRRRLGWLLIAGLVVVIGGSAAIAQETRLGGKIRGGGEVVIPADETVPGDLYVSGGQVRVEGTVDGDLIAAGGEVRVPGEVTGDVLAGSGSIDITGQVGGDARIGAGQVTLGGSVGEDLVVGSGQATITSSGEVGEDFIFGTGQTTLDGAVVGDVLGSTGNYVRRGTVDGSEDVTIAREREPTAADRVWQGVRRFVGLLLVGALLLWLVPRAVDGAAATLRRRPLMSLGVGALGILGFAVLVLAIIVATVLLAIGLGLIRLDNLVGVTLFGTGALLTALGFVFFLAVVFVAQAGVGMSLGRLAVGAGPMARWVALALGVLVIAVITTLPVVGTWVGLLVALIGLGALILEFWPSRRAVPEPG